MWVLRFATLVMVKNGNRIRGLVSLMAPGNSFTAAVAISPNS